MFTNSKSDFLINLFKTKSQLVSILKPGDLVKGTVLAKEPRILYVDLGRYGTGAVYGSEIMNARSMVKNLNVGDPLSAKVVDVENDGGYVELSLSEAHSQKSWDEIKELKERDEVIAVKINGFNTGGLMTEIKGLSAFLPVSQLSNEHYPRVDNADKSKIGEELKKLVDAELKVKVIDLNPRTKKLIISEKEATEESVKTLLKNYEVGQAIDGIISGIADFGAFVKFADNPKIEGLIHLSELAHRLIESPKEVVKMDDLVKVKIIDIKDGRVFLSLKALQEDPWLKVEDKYKAGQIIKGLVYKFTPFGAFINLDKDIQGLIHVSEFGGVEEMKAKISLGESYDFLIDSVKPEEKRLILKLKK